MGLRMRRPALLPALLLACCCAVCRWRWRPSAQTPLCYTVPNEFGPFKLKEDRMLGSGAFGSVYECSDPSGKGRAVKVIPMWQWQLDPGREERRGKLDYEIDVHKHIGAHPNIVQLVDSVDVMGDIAGWPRWKMIVMELAKGGELGDLIEAAGRVSEAQAKYIFKQVVDAVRHLHSKQVIHRDIKTDNILLCTDSTHSADKPFVKLIDFGAGHWAKDGKMEATSCTGTLLTMAPEVILARGDDADASDPNQVASTTEVEYRVRPFGITKYLPGPTGKGARVIEIIPKARYKGDPLGQAFTKGVKVGWVVKTVGGKDVTQMDHEDIMDMLGDRIMDDGAYGLANTAKMIGGKNAAPAPPPRKKLPPVPLPLKVEYAQIKGKPYGPKVDVWSLGVVLYEMVMGKPPFPPDETTIKSGQYSPPTGVSAPLTDLIKKMLVVNPQQRLSLDQVAAHPWLK